MAAGRSAGRPRRGKPWAARSAMSGRLSAEPRDRSTVFDLPRLGPGVADCHLDGIGAVAAATTVERDIAQSCDLVLLNKFGKLEAAGGGLAGAFRVALAAGVPLLTSVSPAHDEAWRQFAKREFAILPADPAAIDLWRRAAQAVAQANRREERRAR